jgi:hypothetical protein
VCGPARGQREFDPIFGHFKRNTQFFGLIHLLGFIVRADEKLTAFVELESVIGSARTANWFDELAVWRLFVSFSVT